MLGFVTSLRARSVARHWDVHCWLLSRTLESMLAQTHPEFRIFVVCHESPEIQQLGHPKVEVCSVSFPAPDEKWEEMCVDKVLKVSIGIRAAIEAGCDSIMLADADDLVSRRLARWTSEHARDRGWLLEAGYSYRYGSNWLRRVTRFHLLCGTSAIVPAAAIRFERDSSYRGEVVSTLAAAGHPHYREVLEGAGSSFRSLPFPGAVYIQHDDSTSSVARRVSPAAPRRTPWRARALAHHALRWLRAAPHLRPLTSALQEEFTIPTRRATALELGGSS